MLPQPTDNNGPEHAAPQPFRDAVEAWRSMGWLGTIPLPIGEKSPPPTGFTGEKNRTLHADDDQIAHWLETGTYNENSRYPKSVGNIGMALGFTFGVDGIDYQVVGIDVDHYSDGGRTKIGGTQLKSLESQLGELPDTVISSARDDGISGIRFYRTPAYTAKGDRVNFIGQAHKDIEVIQYKHRYAVVWPSINPKTGTQYHLYPPGQAPDGINFHDEIPDPNTLPELPDSWAGFLKDSTGGAISAMDTESTPGELADWADETFNAGDEVSACRKMREAVTKWRNRIADEATSHDKVRDAHWEIVRLAGLDGCTGWHWAIEEITLAWTGDVAERNKRRVDEQRGELFRELTGAFRKTKAEIDLATSQGKQRTPPYCVHSAQMSTTGLNMTAPQPNTAQTGLGGRAPDDVHSGHVRMAHRLADAYGDRLLYVHGIGWHHWDNTRWQADKDEARVKRAAMNVIARAINSVIGNGTDEAKRLRSDARKCESASGLEGMIRVARALKPFAATVDDIDADPYLLNVANGTVDLHTGALRPHNPADRITKICAGAYLGADGITSDSQAQPARVGANWEAFLERVQPDDDMRGFVQRLIGVGLIGRIKEHILPILTGKGANGKSVFCEAIQFALGEYAITAEPDLLMHRDGVHPTGERVCCTIR